MAADQEDLAKVSEYGATVRCRACTIFIGTGHLEPEPRDVVGETGPFCAACRRRVMRRVEDERTAIAAGRPLGAPAREQLPFLAARLVELG